MKKEKIKYEAPRARVRGVLLEEGITLESHTISFKGGEVQYNDYTEVAETFSDDSEQYALIF
jgi:hypothetical protein